ncbi:MAG: iron-sulfur cluster assembly accessory protein [Acidimicrobiia bacterium]|jgi:iron-sulfur cluster assembly protein/iron-sulfur cluster insertion protein
MTLEMTPVALTDAATEKVRELLAAEGDETLALRLGARPGGCSGYRYDMYFDAGVADTDAVVDAGAFKVVIDQESVERLMGATVDFRDEGIAGSGFAIDNPNESGHSCTCGKRG